MHLLAYWRLDNYLRDLDEGAGFNFNSRQARLHSAIQPGETLWLFTVVKSPPRYFIVAKLVVLSKTINPPGFKYGAYRVWGDLERSRYFRLRPDEPCDEAFELLRRLPLASGSFADKSRFTLPQACQSIRGLTPEANAALEQFTLKLPDEVRARQVANEYELERELLAGDKELEKVLRRDHVGPSEDRRLQLLSLAPRDRQLVKDLHDRYAGRCQLCAFDSPVVYGIPSAEAHHIVYLSRGGEDSLMNMVLLCPNHHTVVHKTQATFDYARLTFCFPNGRIEPLCLNTHLTPRSAADGPNPEAPIPADVVTVPDLARLTQLVVSQLTPDLLSPEWAAARRPEDHPLTGYCYVAAEALYHLAGAAGSGLTVYRCSLPQRGTHWWLVDATGAIIDPTAEQFPEGAPYSKGTCTFFLSRKPSARAAKLMARVRGQLAR
jgi:5-methylcytosine-specific restriction endonuclease McrA